MGCWLLAMAAAAAGWQLGDEVRVLPAAGWEGPAAAWLADEGWLFEVEDADGQTVGAAFVGRGSLTVDLQQPLERLAVANLLAVRGGVDAEWLRPAVDSGRLALEADRGVFVGLDAWERLARDGVAVEREGRLVTRVDDDGQVEVVVTADRALPAAERIARQLLVGWEARRRQEGVHPDGWMEVDRWARALDPGAEVPMWGEVRTVHDWSAVTGRGLRSGWVSYRRGRGVPAGRAEAVVASGCDVGGCREVVLSAAGDVGPHAVLRGAAATVELSPEVHQVGAYHRVSADLEVAAVRGAVAAVVLRVPRVRPSAFGGMPELAPGFALGTLSVDGEEADTVLLAEGPEEVVVAVRIDRQRGDSARVEARWLDRQRYAHAIELSAGSPVGTSSTVQPVGTTTGLVPAFPRLGGPRPAEERPLPALVRVGSPQTHGRQVAASSGRWQRGSVRHGVRWDVVQTVAPGGSVVLGRWAAGQEEDAEPSPLRAHLLGEGADRVPDAVSRLAHLQDRAFGLAPPEALTVVELHALVGEVGVVAAPGMVAFHPYAAPPFHRQEAERYVAVQDTWSTWLLAYGLHASAWAERGGDPEAGHAAALAVATLMVQGGQGRDAVQPWWGLFRAEAEPWGGLDDSSWGGGFTLGRSLPSLVGTEPVARALGAVLAAGEVPTYAGLHQALEAATGLDLDGVVATQLIAKLAPKMSATLEGEVVTVTSNVPFGTLYAPVRVQRGADTAWVTVPVVDGVGVARVRWPHDKPPRRAVIDPNLDWLLQRPAMAHPDATAVDDLVSAGVTPTMELAPLQGAAAQTDSLKAFPGSWRAGMGTFE